MLEKVFDKKGKWRVFVKESTPFFVQDFNLQHSDYSSNTIMHSGKLLEN